MRQLARVTVTTRDLDLLQCIRSVQADIWLFRQPQVPGQPAGQLRKLLGSDNIGK
jgi:hypothetical protein